MSAWRVWILLNPQRGLLGREERYGWETFDAVRSYVETRMSAFDVEARHEKSGERWQRVRRKWSKAAEPVPAGHPAPSPPMQKMWWQD